MSPTPIPATREPRTPKASPFKIQLSLQNLKNQIMTTNLWVEQVRETILPSSEPFRLDQRAKTLARKEARNP